MTEQPTDLRETVRARYAAATAVTSGSVANDCCGPQAVEIDPNFGSTLYATSDCAELPAEAVAASLGCGNPPPSPRCARANACSTWAPAAGSTYSCPRADADQPGRPTGWT